LGAKELGIRDLRHATHVQSQLEEAYKQLLNIYVEEGDLREALAVAHSAMEKGIVSSR
jgi:pentatricopeptide repeat protein